MPDKLIGCPRVDVAVTRRMSRYCGGSNPAEYMEIHDRRTARLLRTSLSQNDHSSLIFNLAQTIAPALSGAGIVEQSPKRRDCLSLANAMSIGILSVAEMRDVPRVSIGAVTLSRTSRRRQGHQYEPYWLPNTLHSSAWSDVSDATSTTEADLSTSSAVFAHFTTS